MVQFWLNYWHILISKGMNGFTTNTLMIGIQYSFHFKYFTDIIKDMRRMVCIGKPQNQYFNNVNLFTMK